MADIGIYTFCTKNSKEYATLLRLTAEKFKSKKNKINYYYIRDQRGPKKIDGYKCIDLVNRKDKHSGRFHGKMINRALELCAEDISIMSDCDIALLYPNWDKIIIEMSNKVDIFGIDYPSNKNRYKGFPTSRFFVCNPASIKRAGVNMCASRWNGKSYVSREVVRNKEESVAFCIKEKNIVVYDTGWQLPLKAKIAGMTWEALKCVKINDKSSLFPIDNNIAGIKYDTGSWQQTEWHYGNKIFLSHKQSSRKHALQRKEGLIWKHKINLYTQKNYGFLIKYDYIDELIEKTIKTKNKEKPRNMLINKTTKPTTKTATAKKVVIQSTVDKVVQLRKKRLLETPLEKQYRILTAQKRCVAATEERIKKLLQ